MALAACVKMTRHSLEPLLVIFGFASMLQMPVIQQYVYKKFSEDKHFVYEYTNDTSSCGISITNTSQQELQNEVQTSLANFNVGLMVCWTSASVLSCLFYGALSDRIGRRIIITINCVGSCIDASLMLLGMYLNVSVYIFYLGVIINGLSGAWNGMSMIAYAYMADVTDKKNLPIRLGILECARFCASWAAFYSSGPFIQLYGFYGPQILIASLYFASTLYIIFVIEESLKKDEGTDLEMKETLTTNNKQEEKRKERRNGFERVLQAIKQQPLTLWRTCTKPRPNRWALYVSIAILTVMSAFTSGMYMMITLYLMNRPFCMPPLEIGNFLGTQMVALSVGTFIGTKVLLKFLPRYLVSLLSPISSIIGYIMFAFAKTLPMTYGALAVRAFSALHIPIFHATLSEIVDTTEQGTIFSAVAIMEIIVLFLSAFVFNFSYADLNKKGKANMFFYIPTGFLFIPVVMIILLWYQWKKSAEKRSGETLPETEEQKDGVQERLMKE